MIKWLNQMTERLRERNKQRFSSSKERLAETKNRFNEKMEGIAEKRAESKEQHKIRQAERKEKTREKIEQIKAKNKLPLTARSKRFNSISLVVIFFVAFMLVQTKTWPAPVLLNAGINKVLPRTELLVCLEITFVLFLVCFPLLIFLKGKMKIQDRELPPENNKDL